MIARIWLAAVLVLGMPLQVSRAADAPATAATSQPAKVTPIDFRKLKETLPADLLGNKRHSAEGQKLTLGEFTVTQATADYGDTEKENAPTIHIDIQDFGAAPGMAEAMTAWHSLEIDKESDTGFEKTIKVADQPAYQTYQNEGKSGQIQIYVGSRFYVNVTTSNMSADDVKKLTDALPINKLVELKAAK